MRSLRLPTGDALYMKHVYYDQVCMLCGRENETTIHLFTSCSYAHDCWRVLEESWSLASVESLHSWLEEMREALPVTMLEKVVMVCWEIWENRNAMLWKQQFMDPHIAVRHAISFRESWKTVNNVVHVDCRVLGQSAIAVVSWQLPPPGFLKMNIDVAMDAQRQRMGFGWVIRDDGGRVQGVFMSKSRGFVLSKGS
ncbi:uncharacterized protein LOC116020139 [Ipomoea triloba]|uniref:uncharacterized protein LOC116020139 n=1 Tax=Ipomoea triloba TaxID=35885 RepID=UPI00125D9B77|nr:uncharacterized protein LOC116020139 [Ipomoea triloba]